MASSSDVVKPKVFDGVNFKRWQAKAKLWLTDLKLFWVISNPPVFPLEIPETMRWEEANNAGLACLLAILSNQLFDVYVNFTNAKQLWDELDEKYSEGDNGNESITTNYLNYKMVEGRSVMEQLHELQLHVRDLSQYDCILLEKFQVNVILAKLPPSWRDFVTARRHIKERLTLNELSATINVEERARAGDGTGKAQVQAHQVEVKRTGGSGKPKFKNQPQFKLQPKKMKKKKEDIICFVCGEEGHKANHCHNWKGRGPSPGQHKSRKAEVNVALASSSSEEVKVVDPS